MGFVSRLFLAIVTSFALACAPACALTNAEKITLFGGKNVASCATSNTAIALLPAKLSVPTQNKYKAALCALGATASAGGTLLSKMDFLHFYASDNTPNANVDLTGHGFTAVNNGAMVFFPRVGYQGNGVSGYLTVGYTTGTNGVNFTQNSNSYGVVIANSRTADETWGTISDQVAGTGSQPASFIIPIWSDGKTYVALNSTSSTSATVGSVNAQGVWIASRTSSTAVALYWKGASVVSGSQTSGALATSATVIGARYTNSVGPVVGNFSGDTIAADFAGGGFNSADITAITNALAPLIASSIPTNNYAQWGYGNTPFSWTPTGLTDIDVNNTQAPGFNWYVSPYYGAQVPAAGDFTYSAGILTMAASTSASNYRSRLYTAGNLSSYFTGSVASGVCAGSVDPLANGCLTVTAVAASPGTIPQNNPIVVGQAIALGSGGGTLTAGTNITSLGTGTGGIGTYNLNLASTVISHSMVGESYVGRTFPPGGYYEACFAWIPANSPNTGSSGPTGWPSWWMQDVAGLYSQNLVSAYSTAGRFAEIDFFEALPTTTAGSPVNNSEAHDWTNTAGGSFGAANSLPSANAVITNANMGNPTFTNQNCYETLWVTSNLNGGVGFVQRFLNNVALPGAFFTYASGAGANPAFTPSNPSGVLFEAEQGNFPLIVEGGYSTNSMALGSVTVRQH